MLHNASPQRIPQDIGGRSKAVPEKSERKMKYKGKKTISRNIFNETFSTFQVTLIIDTSTLDRKMTHREPSLIDSPQHGLHIHSRSISFPVSHCKVLDLPKTEGNVTVLPHGRFPFPGAAKACLQAQMSLATSVTLELCFVLQKVQKLCDSVLLWSQISSAWTAYTKTRHQILHAKWQT